MLGVDSVLPRQWLWTFSVFQVMLQNQNSILEEVAAKILPPFPTMLPLFIYLLSVAPTLDAVVKPTFVCLKISV